MINVFYTLVFLTLALLQQNSSAVAQSLLTVIEGKHLNDGNFQLVLLPPAGEQITITTTKYIASGGHGAFYRGRFEKGFHEQEIGVKRTNETRDIIRPNLIAEKLRFDHINRIHDAFGWHDGTKKWQVVLMDFNSGPNLEEYLQQSTMTNGQIRSIFQQIVDAIAYAHSKEVYHFHCKPPNIVFTEGNTTRVKLIDFDTVTSQTSYSGHKAPSQLFFVFASYTANGISYYRKFDRHCIAQALRHRSCRRLAPRCDTLYDDYRQ